jgi:nitrogenase molybdenum-iron protein alpha/beta subunit
MSALVKIQKEADKEVFAVKLGETYVAVVNDDDNFYFLPDLYKSPLVACNAARSEKRKNSIVRNVKKKVNGVELKKPTKIGVHSLNCFRNLIWEERQLPPAQQPRK